MLPRCFAFVLIFLFVGFVYSNVETCECETHTHCEVVGCNDNDQCESARSGSSDPGCCSTDADCAAGFADDIDLQNCLLPNCYEPYFVCANFWNCTSFDPPQRPPCSESSECDDYSTYCTNSVCSDNFCFMSLIYPKRVGCCDVINGNRDCTEIPCMVARCDPYYYTCVYEPDDTCVGPHSPSIAVSPPLQSGTSTPSISATVTIAPSPSSLEPSPPPTPSESSAPASPSISPIMSTPMPSNSTTNTASSSTQVSESPMATPSATTSASVPSTEATPSTTPTTSMALQSMTSTNSEVIPTPETSETKVVDVTELSSDPETNNSVPWLWLLIICFGVILASIVILVVVGLVLRKRYLDTRFSPIELIDDDEFPM